MALDSVQPTATMDDVPEDVLLTQVFTRVDSKTRWHTLPLVCKAWHRMLTPPSPVWSTLHIPSSTHGAPKHAPRLKFVKKLRRLAASVHVLTIGAAQPHALLACLPLLSAMRFCNLHHLQLHTPLPLTMVKPLCTGVGGLRSLSLHVTMRGSNGTSSSDLDMSALARLQDLEVCVTKQSVVVSKQCVHITGARAVCG